MPKQKQKRRGAGEGSIRKVTKIDKKTGKKRRRLWMQGYARLSIWNQIFLCIL